MCYSWFATGVSCHEMKLLFVNYKNAIDALILIAVLIAVVVYYSIDGTNSL